MLLKRFYQQLCLSYAGARNASHVADHQRLFTFELSEKDSQQIEEVLEQARRPKGDCYSWERGGTF